MKDNIYSLLFYCINYIDPTIEWIIITFPFNIQNYHIFLYQFFYSELLMIWLLKKFFIKSTNDFATIKSFYFFY